jgi:hypothetical protein
MENIRKVYDSGATLPYTVRFAEIDAFMRKTGSKRMVALRWEHDGTERQLRGFACPLPDLSGAAVVESTDATGRNSLRVVNADGRTRFVLEPPELDPRFDSSKSRLESVRPGWPASRVDFGVWAAYQTVGRPGVEPQSVGLLLDIDWKTGALRRWLTTPPGV